MGLYQCRGQITATSSDSNNYRIFIKAITQFECKKNRIIKELVNAGSGGSFEKTVFNIFMAVENTQGQRRAVNPKNTEPEFLALPVGYPILVSAELHSRQDDFDTDPQWEWTFVIEGNPSKANADYELRYIQLGPQESDE